MPMLASDGDLYERTEGDSCDAESKICHSVTSLHVQNRVPARLPFVPFYRNKLNIEGGREEEN